MGTATLTLAYLMLAAGGTPDVWPINQSNIRIPIHIDPVRRPLIKQLVLYASSDEGRTWKQVAVAAPEQDAFAQLSSGANAVAGFELSHGHTLICFEATKIATSRATPVARCPLRRARLVPTAP